MVLANVFPPRFARPLTIVEATVGMVKARVPAMAMAMAIAAAVVVVAVEWCPLCLVHHLFNPQLRHRLLLQLKRRFNPQQHPELEPMMAAVVVRVAAVIITMATIKVATLLNKAEVGEAVEDSIVINTNAMVKYPEMEKVKAVFTAADTSTYQVYFLPTILRRLFGFSSQQYPMSQPGRRWPMHAWIVSSSELQSELLLVPLRPPISHLPCKKDGKLQ